MRLSQSMNHALSFDSSKRPGEDSEVEPSITEGLGKILDRRLQERDSPPQLFWQISSGCLNGLSIWVNSRNVCSVLGIAPSEPALTTAYFKYAKVLEIDHCMQGGYLITFWIFNYCHGILGLHLPRILRHKYFRSCRPKQGEGSRVTIGEILHCVQNDEPGIYFRP
jgi:hypothetical protein